MNNRPSSRIDAFPEINLVSLYYTLRRQLWLIAVCAVVALLGGFIYLSVAPRVYLGQAVIQVPQSERRVVKIEDLEPENPQSIEFLKTLEQNLSNWTVLERVVRNPDLKLTPASLGLKQKP